VPIRIAPGIAGVEPKLAFAYNSQGATASWAWLEPDRPVGDHALPQTIAQDGTHVRSVSPQAIASAWTASGKGPNPTNSPSVQYWAATTSSQAPTNTDWKSPVSRRWFEWHGGLSGRLVQGVTKSGEIIEYGTRRIRR